MIVCHCQRITDRDINAAVDWMRAADPETLITPGRIYRALGKSAHCGGCVSLFLAIMRRNPNLAIPMKLRMSRGTTQEIESCKAIPRLSSSSTGRSAAS